MPQRPRELPEECVSGWVTVARALRAGAFGSARMTSTTESDQE